ncbi:MAG TPA: transglycosylase SLT domain-containing protein [Beijerinckiaceae bacterium]|nr:transglycosylase SLT domain-containing protein [Beijerinckiaceae bacterium]
MTQTAAAVADAAFGWRANRSRGRSVRRKSGARDCPIAIIARGVALLTVLGGGFGYALASVRPASQPQLTASASANPILPQRRLKVSWTPPLATPAQAFVSSAALATPVTHPPVNARVRRTFLRLLQTALSSRRKVLHFGPMRVKRSIVETIMRAARVTHSDPVLLMAIADKESSFSTAVAARTSSAVGLFQFVDSTWLKVVREFGARFGLAKEASLIVGPHDRPTVVDPAERARILDLRRNAYLSAVLAAEMLKRDGNRIAQRIGRGLTSGETYLAHFLGPNDAERFMEKVVGQPHFRAAVLLPKPARANFSLFYARDGRHDKQLSVAAVHHEFETMMGVRLDRYKSIGAAAGLSAYADLGR